MARNGSGTYALPATMAIASSVASSSTVNSIMNDVAQALTDSINKDGTKAFEENQSMGGNKLIGLGAATALTDAVQLSQLQKGNVSHAATVAGTVDAITMTFNPTITSLTTGMKIRWVSAGVNTIAGATINADSLGVIVVKKNPGAVALLAGDLGAAGTENEATYNGTNWVLTNPPAVSDGIVLNSNTDFTPQAQLTNASSNASSAPYTIMRRARGTIAVPVVVQSGDNIGTVLWQVWDGAAWQNSASITAAIDATPGAGDVPTSWIVSVSPDGSATLVERLRVRSTGALALNGNANFGTAGQFLKSNGDAPPTWAAGGGHVFLGNIPTTSGTGPNLTVSLTNYRKLLVVLRGCSPVSGASPFMLLNGVQLSGTMTNAASVLNGYVDIELTSGYGNHVGSFTGGQASFGIGNATTLLTFTWNSGQACDAGSIDVYGVL